MKTQEQNNATVPTDEEILEAWRSYPEKHCYAPNSIHHGQYIARFGFSEQAIKIELERLTDYVEWLWDHTNHLDHTTRKDVYEQFIVWEMRQALECNQQKEATS